MTKKQEQLKKELNEATFTYDLVKRNYLKLQSDLIRVYNLLHSTNRSVIIALKRYKANDK